MRSQTSITSSAIASFSTNQSSPRVLPESQLNPPLSVAWKFGANYTSNRGTALLAAGEEYLAFFNLISDGTNVYATASKAYFPSPGSPGSGRGAYLLALSLEGGKALWELKLPVIDPKGSGLAFLNNDSNTHKIIVGMEGALLSVDDRQGRAVWSVNGSYGFPIASPDDKVYTSVGSYWGGNGSKICSYQGGGRIPAYGGGRIYTMSGQAGSPQGILYAFDARTCEQLWTAPLGPKPNHWSSSGSTFHDGRVYAADDTNLYAVEAATGKIIWNVAHGEVDWWPPSAHGNAVYLAGGVGSGAAGVAAFNATNGQLLWRSGSVAEDSLTSALQPSISGRYVYAAIGCTITALDSQTGKTSWQSSLNGCKFWYSYYGPLISGSYMVLSDDVSYLVAFQGNLSN
jgi:outer membrane protein assembly factor BamB